MGALSPLGNNVFYFYLTPKGTLWVYSEAIDTISVLLNRS